MPLYKGRQMKNQFDETKIRQMKNQNDTRRRLLCFAVFCCLGFTTFIEEMVTLQLSKYDPFVSNPELHSYFDLRKNRRVPGITIHQNITEAKAAHGLKFPGFYAFRHSAEFFDKVRNTISLLNAALDDKLMWCIGLVMKKFEFKSLTEGFFIEAFTNCTRPLEINIDDLMRFWLFEKSVPTLKISIDYESDSNLAEFTYTYDSDEKPNSEPQIPLVIRDEHDKILHYTIFVTRSGQKTKLEFDFKNKHQLFFASVHDYGNFMVSYPDKVYSAFFQKIESRSDDNSDFDITIPYANIFVKDMLDLSHSNKIDMFWLYKILRNRQKLENGLLLLGGGSFSL